MNTEQILQRIENELKFAKHKQKEYSFGDDITTRLNYAKTSGFIESLEWVLFMFKEYYQ